MVNSEAKTVNAYLQEIPADRRESLVKIRTLCLKSLGGYQESMRYGMPSYGKVDGEIEVAFANQKNYISLYILKTAILDKHRTDLSHLDLGKGCIRFRKAEQIDFDLVTILFNEIRQSDTPVC